MIAREAVELAARRIPSRLRSLGSTLRPRCLIARYRGSANASPRGGRHAREAASPAARGTRLAARGTPLEGRAPSTSSTLKAASDPQAAQSGAAYGRGLPRIPERAADSEASDTAPAVSPAADLPRPPSDMARYAANAAAGGAYQAASRGPSSASAIAYGESVSARAGGSGRGDLEEADA
jgi:hypothetical protein